MDAEVFGNMGKSLKPEYSHYLCESLQMKLFASTSHFFLWAKLGPGLHTCSND